MYDRGYHRCEVLSMDVDAHEDHDAGGDCGFQECFHLVVDLCIQI